MIVLNGDCLDISFPELHPKATCGVAFQRTLRLPEDGRDYPLPPGLGRFPLRHLDDFGGRVPERWMRRGGVVMPMHQAEAMWISFTTSRDFVPYPHAIKIAAGKINAVTGEPWRDGLNTGPQDYLVLPEQPWLDGFCVAEGIIRQFVAMSMGEGYSVEEQLTGKAASGGIQVIAYPMKRERFEALENALRSRRGFLCEQPFFAEPGDMGLAAGGRMKQQVFEDPHGLDAWDQRHASRCFVTIMTAQSWQAATGQRPPAKPPTAADYTRAGLPWFEHYRENAVALKGSEILGKVGNISETAKAKGDAPLPAEEPFEIGRTVRLGKSRDGQVREAEL